MWSVGGAGRFSDRVTRPSLINVCQATLPGTSRVRVLAPVLLALRLIHLGRDPLYYTLSPTAGEEEANAV